MNDINSMRELAIGMTNFDGSIDEGLTEALRAEPAMVCAQHSAWNFCGYVWFENGKYREQVWRYHSPIDEIEADTLKELMEEVNAEYGSS